ncbi:MAG: CBS domain-containing protein [Burkholderiales bacterium]|nr:CBS domain-containing protein [Burkholderiales bacterium]
MYVAKHMTAPVVTVRADADYRSAFDLMRNAGVHHLPVVDAQGRLVGLVAQRDLLLAATRYQNAPVEIVEVMHRPVISAKADLLVVEAARLMMSHKIGCLPVVDADLNLQGIITESDLFSVFVRLLSGRGAAAARPPAAGMRAPGKAPARKRAARKAPARKRAARKR